MQFFLFLLLLFFCFLVAVLPQLPVAQLVKSPPALREAWVRSLGCEDPLERGKAAHSRILALENPVDCVVHGAIKGGTRLSGSHFASLSHALLTAERLHRSPWLVSWQLAVPSAPIILATPTCSLPLSMLKRSRTLSNRMDQRYIGMIVSLMSLLLLLFAHRIFLFYGSLFYIMSSMSLSNSFRCILFDNASFI